MRTRVQVRDAALVKAQALTIEALEAEITRLSLVSVSLTEERDRALDTLKLTEAHLNEIQASAAVWRRSAEASTRHNLPVAALRTAIDRYSRMPPRGHIPTAQALALLRSLDDA